MIVPMNMANGALFFGRGLDRRVAVGAAFGFTGICIIFWNDILAFDAASGASLGLLLCLTGTYSAISEEHTSELQSLMRNSYAVFCLTKKQHRTRRPH